MRRTDINVAVPKESVPGERRVAGTPESVARLISLGFEVTAETGAGEDSGFADGAYRDAGASIADDCWSDAAVILKVRPPSHQEASRVRDGAIIICLFDGDPDAEAMATLASKKASVVALDRVPRISRAQSMDVLSSMASLAGYRAVIEAAAQFDRPLGAQVTAAGSSRPARVLVIGAGVAGLAAIGAARSLGAEVRAIDTRPPTREQVESLGATFLELDLDFDGEGEGGYAKVLADDILKAEQDLVLAQAPEIDIIVTTALIPGRPAPLLITREALRAMRAGSVILDLAALRGGNCEGTRRDEIIEIEGVKVIGYSDLPSRMGETASRFFAANVANLVKEMTTDGALTIDLENEIVRGATIMHEGERLEPPPPKMPSPAPPAASATKPEPTALKPLAPANPRRRTAITGIAALVLVGLMLMLGRYAPQSFLPHFTVFILACFVGWQVVWNVTPALHTPLMSVTNAISGIIIIGGLLQAGSGEWTAAAILGGIAVLVATINIAGGFLVTQRMLRMFRREGA